MVPSSFPGASHRPLISRTEVVRESAGACTVEYQYPPVLGGFFAVALRPHVPIEAPILNRLGDMVRLDHVRLSQVRDGPANLGGVDAM